MTRFTGATGMTRLTGATGITRLTGATGATITTTTSNWVPPRRWVGIWVWRFPLCRVDFTHGERHAIKLCAGVHYD
jgi:hypothetical protein